jgi:5-formyltetrahydrofolate cyclo-ligase
MEIDRTAPGELDSLKVQAKRHLRRRMRSLRAAIPERARALRSDSLVARLLELPELVSARSIALFWPMEGQMEVDVRKLDQEYRSRGVRVFYPRVGVAEPHAPEFAETASTEDLVESGRGFLEPVASNLVATRGDIDVVIVPALAVSATGHRIGYGSGFYDAVLPTLSPPACAIAVAFDFQLLAEVPTMAMDVACALVVTDARVLRMATM